MTVPTAPAQGTAAPDPAQATVVADVAAAMTPADFNDQPTGIDWRAVAATAAVLVLMALRRRRT